MPEPTALIFPNWQRELFKDHSRNRIFASTATADPVPPTVCGISSCGGHGRFLGRAHAINARRAKLASKSLKAPHGTGHTLAISDAALSTYFNLQDRLAQIFVVNHRDIPELKAPGLVGPQPSIDGE